MCSQPSNAPARKLIYALKKIALHIETGLVSKYRMINAFGGMNSPISFDMKPSKSQTTAQSG